jgi:hypothetical protein
MWDLEDGSEYGLVIPVYESDTDETLIDRAWTLAVWVAQEIRPKNKSDLRVIRRKKKN